MKRAAVITTILLGIIFLVIILSLSSNKPSQHLPFFTQPTPTPILPPAVEFRAINYHEIFKDNSTATQMADKYQNPLSTESQGGYTVGHFASDSATLSTDVYQQNGVAKMVVQTFATDNNYYGDFQVSHTNSEQETLYDPIFSHGSGFSWKIFPSEGVAFLTSPDVGFSGRVLYFQPTTYSNFLKTEAQTLGLTKSDLTEQGGGLEQGQ
ncbi:MAG TPA: hypothetical protein VF189_04665 [Patescibacteria group bacterium]